MYIQNINELSFREDYGNNKRNETPLEFIKIIGLFNLYDVEIQFDKMVNIYIGENGLGKTTILNCIYYILTMNFDKLRFINFKKIEIKNKNKNAITIRKGDIINLSEIKNHGYSLDFFLGKKISKKEIGEYFNNQDNDSFYEYFRKYDGKKHDKDKIHNLYNQLESITKTISKDIIYLPTYRRIEDDFASLGLDKMELEDNGLLIKFGMEDVEQSIENVLNKIRNIAVKEYNDMTGNILTEYVEGTTENEDTNEQFNIEIVKIVLDRLAEKVNDDNKEKIINIVENYEIYNDPKYRNLRKLLYKLVKSYSTQERYDNQILNFVETCNKYLNDKKFVYDQRTLNLTIYLKGCGKKVELRQLSSGEKQIVSLFSKLYFECEKSSIIIIDEPELSLSIRWQKMLLPDIINTKKCKLLLAVTHSPFIFDNRYDLDAKEMIRFISDTSGEQDI